MRRTVSNPLGSPRKTIGRPLRASAIRDRTLEREIVAMCLTLPLRPGTRPSQTVAAPWEGRACRPATPHLHLCCSPHIDFEFMRGVVAATCGKNRQRQSGLQGVAASVNIWRHANHGWVCLQTMRPRLHSEIAIWEVAPKRHCASCVEKTKMFCVTDMAVGKCLEVCVL